MSLIDKNSARPMGRVLLFLLRLWRRHAWLVAMIVAAMIGATLTDVLMPLFAGKLVTDVAATGPRLREAHAALVTVGIMAGLGASQTLLRNIVFRGVVALSLRNMAESAQEAFNRVQRFSSDWHANSFAGSVQRKITRGMWAIDMLNDTLLVALLPALCVLGGTAAVLGWRWPVMGGLLAGGALLYIVLATSLSVGWVAPAAQLSNRWDTRVGGALADAISCNAVVKAFGAEAREDEILRGVLAKWAARTRRTWIRGTNSGTIQGVALLLLRTGVTSLAVWLWWSGRASPGDIATVLTAYFVIHGYLRDIGFHISNLQRGVNDMEELVALHSQGLGVEDAPDARPIRIGNGEIVFDRVGFRYGPHALPFFEDFSLRIAAGERVGLVGHSGSGKTSFVKLLQRLHDVSAGAIRIDGQDIRAVRQASLRANLAIVAQEPILFHRSLADNIAYARPGASLAEIEQAAWLANAHEFIARLPRGYQTLVGERGVKLSGGERQRVAIARAFLANAPILILDEATASLDSESEALIQEAMERLMTGRTVIVIAHRLSTVRALDRILVFDRGRLAEEGPHEALLTREGGIYRRLFERQAMGLLPAES
nr:ABC transporter ATP-binding protein [Acidocella sp. MX-AZ02]